MSKELREFYLAYKAWLDAGAPEKMPFSRSVGLCANLCHTTKGMKREQENALHDELQASFSVRSMFPFGMEDYYHRKNCATMYLCPKRIEWVNYQLSIPTV